MSAKFLHRFIAMWQKLSAREQRLAYATVGVFLVMVIVTSVRAALGQLQELDITIGRLEDDLAHYTFQLTHKALVEARYAEIAAQHSSAWTEAEIHDRLRQEIYRLARRNPQGLDEKGIPLNTPNEAGNLVEIPSLGKGVMAEGGEGYREYMINLRIPPTRLEYIVNFLERLQQSPQSLRVDAIELHRAPEADGIVSAVVDVTRIVADGAAPETAEATEPGSGLGRISLQASEWHCREASVRNVEGAEGRGAVEVLAAGANAEAFLTKTLPSGAVYEMIADIAAGNGAALLAVGLESDNAPFPGAEPLRADGRAYRYQVQFTLPPDSGSVKARCPWIQIQESGTVVHITNLLVRKVAEN